MNMMQGAHLRRWAWLGALLTVLLALACGEDSDDGDGLEASDSGALQELLLRPDLPPGTVVSLTPTTYRGHFKVPAGLTIDGNGATLSGDDGTAVFSLVGGDAGTPTRLQEMRIVNDGLGVVGYGGGHVALEAVEVEVSRLGGVMVEGLDGFEARDVSVRGSVDAGNVSELDGETIDADRHPIAGLFAASTGQVDLAGVTVSGTAGFSGIFLDSTVVWDGGLVEGWVGIGVLVEGGTLDLSNVELRDSLRDGALQRESTGVLVTQRGFLTSRSVTMANVGGLGLMQDNARGVHVDLVVEGASRAGVWVQNTFPDDGEPALAISGDSRLADNLGLGLYLNGFEGLDLDGLTISHTRDRGQLLGDLGLVELGDGVQMIGASGLVRMERTRLTGNSRVGWLLDGDGGAAESPLAFSGSLTIDRGDLGDISQTYGFIAQNTRDDDPILASGALVAPDFEAQDAQARETGLSLGVARAFEEVASFGGVLGPEGLIGGVVDQEGRLIADGLSVDDVGIVVENGN